VRLKVDTLVKAVVVPTSAVQRGPMGTFSYVIGEGDVVSARPVTVTQQNEHDAVVASGLSPDDRVVTTGFANLSDRPKVIIGRSDQTPAADLAPRKRSRAPRGKDGQKEGQKDGQAHEGHKDGQPSEGQKKDWQERRAKRMNVEGDQKGQTGPAQGGEPAGS